MKHTNFKLFLLACTMFGAMQVANAQMSPDASFLSPNGSSGGFRWITGNNMDFLYQPDLTDEPYTINTTKGGLNCIEIPVIFNEEENQYKGRYAYFRTNNTITSDDNNLIIKITYFDEGTGDLQLQYNATNNDNFRTVNIVKTNTNAWITATITLTDASFRKSSNQQADFRIGSVNYIREITITKGTMNPENEPKSSSLQCRRPMKKNFCPDRIRFLYPAASN